MAQRRSAGERRREALARLVMSREVLATEVAEPVLGEHWQRFLAVQAIQSRVANAGLMVIDASLCVRGTGGRPPGVAAMAARTPLVRFAAAQVPVGGGPVGEVEL